MININNLSLSFGAQTLLTGISFNINKGERIGLVGRNGSGKTTLFKLFTGQLSPDSGMISIPNHYRIGYLEQHIRFSKPTVLEEAALGLRDDEKNSLWIVERILMGLGFSKEDMEQSPELFSGGYQVRLNLAKVLASTPDLLLLDEPTNYLDILSIRWLTQFLRRWQGELVLITHDRTFMDSVTTHTMILHRKKAKKVQGNTTKLYEQIAVEEEIYENTRLKDEKKRKETEVFINRFRAKARLASMVQSRIKALEKKEQLDKLEKIQSLEFSFNFLPFPAKKIMEIKKLGFGYDPDRPLIQNLTVSVAKNDRIGIIGKNGKGKSTLLRLLAGELLPQHGSTYGHPEMVCGYFGQTNIERLQAYKTVEEELMDSDPAHNRKKVRDVCGSMMFQGDDALKKITILSGGEKSRVLLGKILLAPVNLLLLDEPTNHLDMDACDSLLAALDNYNGAILMVTHNEMFLHELANRLIVFENDRVYLFEGSYNDFLEKVGWLEENGPVKKKTSNPRNDHRKKRSILINERSKILYPIEKKIKDIELRIAVLEKNTHLNNEKIVTASGSGNSQLIQELSIINHQNTEEIDRLFQELDQALLDHDRHDKSFEDQLAELPED